LINSIRNEFKSQESLATFSNHRQPPPAELKYAENPAQAPAKTWPKYAQIPFTFKIHGMAHDGKKRK